MSFKMTIPDEMRKKYIERREKDMADLQEALAGSNLEPFKRIGHQLKGNGATYGYDELGELGHPMEEAAGSNQMDLARACLEELAGWIAAHK